MEDSALTHTQSKRNRPSNAESTILNTSHTRACARTHACTHTHNFGGLGSHEIDLVSIPGSCAKTNSNTAHSRPPPGSQSRVCYAPGYRSANSHPRHSQTDAVRHARLSQKRQNRLGNEAPTRFHHVKVRSITTTWHNATQRLKPA